MKYTYILLFSLSLTSCDFGKEKFSTQRCDDLSMASFRGSPRKANLFENHCSGVKIQYTKSHCQKALNDFIFGMPYEKLTKQYGDKVSGCLSKRDIEKFARDEEKTMLMNMSKE